MSTLTKTMVVVVSVLAIFLCGALVVFEMNQANYRQAYEDQKARTAAAMTQALAYQEETSRVKTGQEKVLAQLKDSIQLLESQVSQLARERDSQSKARAQADSTANTAVALSESLRDTIDNMYVAQQFIQEELNKSHANMIVAQTQTIDLRRTLNGEQVKSSQLELIGKLRLEKIQELEDENAKIRRRLQEVTLASNEMRPEDDKVSQTLIRDSGVPIRGEITDLKGELVALSIGSASGVRENTRFRIVRGGNFIGEVLVTEVEASESAGRLVNKLGTVIQGDKVTTGFD